METPTSTPLSTALSTPKSYHSPLSNDETSDELPSQRFRSMEDIYNSSQFALMVYDPVCYDEVASKEEWQQTMKEEMTAIEKNGTWKMKHKARLVAKGYAQQHDIDFEESFSPIARFETDSEEKVYKLTKALYGLKQAPRAWYSEIDGYFQQNGFKRSTNEPTLYVKKGGKNDFIIVCLYVDDIIYTSSSKSLVAEFKSHMKNKFEMTDLGLLHFFLGFEVYQTDGGTFISQKKYAKDLLKKFGMINYKPETTPMNVNEKLKQNDGAEMADAQRFRSLVGGLIYLTHTCSDISYSIGVISSDWVSSLDDRRSVSANVFTLGSGVITWSPKKQETVALSSLEAEYAVATSAAYQAIWLRRTLTKLQHEKEGATMIFCDNKATISMTKNLTFHSRTKHIDIRFHFIRDLVAKEEVSKISLTLRPPSAKLLPSRLKSKSLHFQPLRPSWRVSTVCLSIFSSPHSKVELQALSTNDPDHGQLHLGLLRSLSSTAIKWPHPI
ncbi:putative gag-pol polyprotein, identical [Cucumis melo var. makuwa]|uniref:Gag-pol polyprotein, identical n=1 Tax=Cucumis melo var. makuwa TaxID=1194695 RepID=A0A5A7U730_CUCMM|nr:putative gag-pol polyprotein, identical [Cucumis melo var. makuwa]